MAFHWWRRDAPSNSVDDTLLAELQAEIADHLTELEQDFGRRAESPAVVQEKVRQRFGDAKRIIRKCRWEHRREIILLRVAVVCSFVLVLVVTGGFVVNQRRFQAIMNRQMERLARRMEVMGDAQATTGPTGTISGSAHLRQQDLPVVGARVFVYEERPRHDPEVAHRLLTDDEGRFRVGGLPFGKYFVLAPLVDDNGKEVSTGFMTQSRPIELSDENPQTDLELGLWAKGKLRVSLLGDVPDTVSVNGKSVSIGIEFAFGRRGFRLPLSGIQHLPEGTEWPIIGGLGANFRDSGETGYGYRPSEFPISLSVASGQYHVLVHLIDKNLVLGAPLGQVTVPADIGEAETAQLQVNLPERLDDLRHAGGPWQPLTLEAAIVPPKTHASALPGGK